MMITESTNDHKLHYCPPKNYSKGLIIALFILSSFILCWYHALFQINFTKTRWFDIIGTFLILEFLYTGLFITCHDAMHGAICNRYRQLNHIIGHVCLSAYAWFDYRVMYEKHWLHHKHTGLVNEDPDYHDGRSIGFFAWYAHFLIGYTTKQQIYKMTVWITTLQVVFSVPLLNIIVYMLICGLCSSLRLFYFGTYIPHRPELVDGKFDEAVPWEKSKSASANRLVSFLCCYHFDYHWEHHRWPYAPWWDLWKCKELTKKIN
ncbi:unnamed protein product [Rotaria magnacalcarata]|uniref:Fatty acid desaturase domain-containing protein n=3 Tax=Rotaria magnacalcarata TaxID=392030 RepID=A0A816PXE1_9BILA|nr:unnamed protein product [Rotaria magnacalcarata]CAF2053441.1 unnamed protein product [Rotaria magnacalcarata]